MERRGNVYLVRMEGDMVILFVLLQIVYMQPRMKHKVLIPRKALCCSEYLDLVIIGT